MISGAGSLVVDSGARATAITINTSNPNFTGNVLVANGELRIGNGTFGLGSGVGAIKVATGAKPLLRPG